VVTGGQEGREGPPASIFRRRGGAPGIGNPLGQGEVRGRGGEESRIHGKKIRGRSLVTKATLVSQPEYASQIQKPGEERAVETSK